MRHLFVAATMAVVLANTGGTVVHAQAAASPVAVIAPLNAGERRQVIEELAKALEADFVFPDVGARYAAVLRANLTGGAYDGLTDPTAFGEKVTADLQAVAKDGHLRLAPREAFDQRRPPPADAPASTRPSGPPGLEEARMIGDVAYLRFNEFPEDPAVARAARRFLLAHAAAKAVIIDARPHRGGGLGVMDAILPLLYAQQTHLVRMDTRASVADSGPMQDGPTLVRQPSEATIVSRDHVVTPDTTETRLQHVPVYYLTSRRTASAAEHLALAFKRTHRAILIGEMTRGAGHFGGLQPIGDRFAAFIPVGRTYDPDTGWDWEGRGVAPDVAVPADQALDEALKEARSAGAQLAATNRLAPLGSPPARAEPEGNIVVAAPRQVAPGVWLISGALRPRREPDGNTVIFEAPGGLIVVDTGRHLAHRQVIEAFAKSRHADIVAIVNSHWHLDHVSGNADLKRAYPGAKVYASRAIDEALTGFLAQSAAENRKALESDDLPPETKEDIRSDLATVANGAALRPDVVIDASRVMRLGGRKLGLNLARDAATAGDVWVWDPASGVAAVGDLVTLPSPFLDTACPRGWEAALATIWATPFKIAVPGHGAPITRAQFATYRASFARLIDCSASSRDKTACATDWVTANAALGGSTPREHKLAQDMTEYYVADVLRRNRGKSASCKRS